MEKIKGLFKNVLNGWNSLSKNKKISLTIVLTFGIVFVIIYSFMVGNVNYVPIYTNMDIQDAANIVNDLENKGNISYKLENGGRDILIDQKKLDKYRLDLAMDGILPQNSKGFEIFDNQGLMVTDEDRKIMYQRALEGELQRSIVSLEEVNLARVHLVLSEESIFNNEVQNASASVILELKPLAKLQPEMIKGIIALVSGAVKNLPEGNVKIIDSKGNLISSGIAVTDEHGSVDSVYEYETIRKTFETEIEKEILEILQKAYGYDKIIVTVFSQLDFDSQEKTIIKYDQDNVIRSQQIRVSGEGVDISDASSGPIGDESKNSIIDNNDNNINSYENITNYEIGEEKIIEIKAPGKVEKISASIIYDGVLSEEQKESISSIVSATIGYDQTRGDLISVEGIKFDRSYEEQIAQELEQLRQEEANRSWLVKNKEIVMFIGLVILIILMLIILMNILTKRKKRGQEESLNYSAISITDEAYEDQIPAIEVEDNSNEQDIKKYAQQHPDKVADLLKSWIKN